MPTFVIMGIVVGVGASAAGLAAVIRTVHTDQTRQRNAATQRTLSDGTTTNYSGGTALVDDSTLGSEDSG